jgi:hypothetical protein
MTGIFISYRREDSGPYAGRLYDALVSHFGRDGMFFDVDAIGPGEDFREVIQRTCSSCKILLAVIGKQWATVCDKNGRLRLESKNDTLRIEIALALQNGLRVIPVLVGGAEMPDESALPEDLQALAYRNAWDVSDKRFHQDVQTLVDVLKKTLESVPQGMPVSAGQKQKTESSPPAKKPRMVPKKSPQSGVLSRKVQSAASKKSISPTVGSESCLYPLYGIILGKTTVRELEKMGQRADSLIKQTGKPYPYYTVKETQFWYDEASKVVDSISAGTLYPVPEPWGKLGIRWGHTSYNQWLSLLKDMGYSIKIETKPHIDPASSGGPFSANVVGRKTGLYPHQIELHFFGGNLRTTTSSTDILLSIHICCLDDEYDEDLD